MIGFGSIGQGVLPLILRHIGIKPRARSPSSPRTIAAACRKPKRFGVEFIGKRLTREQLPPCWPAGSARATSWSISRSRSPRRRWSSSARRRARSISTPASSRGRAATPIPTSRCRGAPTTHCATPCWSSPKYRGGPTAVIAHGANPGLVSHFVKQALMNLATRHRREGQAADKPRRLGPAGPPARRQGDPHRRARHPGLAQSQGGRRVRQYLVDRRLRLGRQPAVRDGLGHAREGAAGRRRAPRVRL